MRVCAPTHAFAYLPRLSRPVGSIISTEYPSLLTYKGPGVQSRPVLEAIDKPRERERGRGGTGGAWSPADRAWIRAEKTNSNLNQVWAKPKSDGRRGEPGGAHQRVCVFLPRVARGLLYRTEQRSRRARLLSDYCSLLSKTADTAAPPEQARPLPGADS